MRKLRLVGPGEDGASLVVEAIDAGSLEGERFTLALDDRLRTMTEPPPEQQPEPEPAESRGPTPTPREIQVRVRAGETAEGLAAHAGIPLERVMRFALPVLQERIRVTDEARRARARRGGDGALVPFGELIDSRLARHGVDPTSAHWDAYRREDGGWTVTSKFSSYERDVQAKFSFALVNRTVSALDDIAADLLSDRPVAALLPPAEPEPQPAAEVGEVGESPRADWAPDWPDGAPPRLTAVPNPARTEPVRAQEASPAVRPPSRRQKAHTRPVPIDSDDELFDQDAFAQEPWHEPPLPFEAGSRAGSPRHRAPRTGDRRGAEPVRLARPATALDPEPVSLARTDVEAEPTGVAAGAGDFDAEDADFRPEPTGFWAEPAGTEDAAYGEPEDAGTPAHAAGSGRRGRRSGDKPRMPSWDDILLGVRHKTD